MKTIGFRVKDLGFRVWGLGFMIDRSFLPSFLPWRTMRGGCWCTTASIMSAPTIGGSRLCWRAVVGGKRRPGFWFLMLRVARCIALGFAGYSPPEVDRIWKQPI